MAETLASFPPATPHPGAPALTAQVRRHVVDVDLRLPLTSSITVLFGPSGAGKTTLLRCLAGLDRPESGRIGFGDEIWDAGRTYLPTRRRRVGLLFQDHALFPHLDVDANVAYGLRALPRRERPARVAEALAVAGAAHLGGRPVRQLSGGEAQRVALARALAPRPRLLLLDEPLSALDTPTRARLRTELRRALATAGVPSIVVTHDRAEALALGDRIAVLIDGRLHQVGDLPTVFGRPADPEVAAAVGVESTLPGEVIEIDAGLAKVKVGPHMLLAAWAGAAESLAGSGWRRAASPPAGGGKDAGEVEGPARSGPDWAPGEAELAGGDPVLVCIRAEEIALEPPHQPHTASPRNRLPAMVTAMTAEGPLLRVDLDSEGVLLAAYITRLAAEDLDLRPGARITAVIKTPSVHLVPRPDPER